MGGQNHEEFAVKSGRPIEQAGRTHHRPLWHERRFDSFVASNLSHVGHFVFPMILPLHDFAPSHLRIITKRSIRKRDQFDVMMIQIDPLEVP